MTNYQLDFDLLQNDSININENLSLDFSKHRYFGEESCCFYSAIAVVRVFLRTVLVAELDRKTIFFSSTTTRKNEDKQPTQRNTT